MLPIMDRRRVVNLLDATLAAEVAIGDVRAWCREHGVAVRTFYRHRARWRAERDLSPRSRRPHRSPGAAPPDLDAWICKLRVELAPDNGADFIRDALARVAADTGPAWTVPARSTINRVLARHELLDTNPRKRPRSSWRRFAFAQPRDCYQIDATELALADGTTVVAVEVLDDCTRMLVACHAARSETADAAITAIGKAISGHGPPALVLSDNGAAFTSRHIHPNAGPSRLARYLAGHGSRLIHSSPYHPQTCGKVERHHQTLKKWMATRPTPATLRGLQHLLDSYRGYYNTRRPHSALHRRTPQQAWTTAPSHGGPTRPPRQTDATVHRCQVSATGTITVGQHRLGVGLAYRGRPLTAIRDTNRAITIYDTDGHPIAALTPPTKPGYVSLTGKRINPVPHVPGHPLATCPGT